MVGGVTGDRRVSAERLRQYVVSAFQTTGMSEDHAQEAACVLLWASLRGVDTHGVRNLVPYYLRNLKNGGITVAPRMRRLADAHCGVRFDGDGGTGLVTAGIAMRAAIERARDNGVGIATVTNTHHLGPAGYFASMALEHDMLGMCATGHFFGKGFHTGVAPIGGKLAMLSTNPISFAAPAADHPPFLLDMSTATATVNRIEAFGQTGQAIPEGWAKDCASQPTTNPHEAKILYPLGGEMVTGGHKGVGLSMMVAVLTGVLSGAWRNSVDDQDVAYDQPTMGHFLAAIRIDQFMPVSEFKASLDAMLNSIVACPSVDEAEPPIDYPGRREARTLAIRSDQGIPIDARLMDEFQAAHAGLELD